MIRLDLPYPPSLNHYYVRTKRGTAVGLDGRKYREAVEVIARVTMHNRGVATLSGDLWLALDLYPPSLPRVLDVDNALKPLLDALQSAGVYGNDRQICRLEVTRRELMGPHGAAVVRVGRWEE